LADPFLVISEEVISEMKLDEFATANNTPKVFWLKRLFIKLVMVPKIRKMFAKDPDG
jgi:hypothetical protein